ncbi:hypothetical protein [Thermococcus sp.]
MIALLLSALIGTGMAFIAGKVKGKGAEIVGFATAVPFFTYAIGAPLWNIAGDVVGFNLRGFAGFEVFASLILAIALIEVRAREALSIDEYIQVVPLSSFVLSAGAGLVGTLSRMWYLLSVIILLLLMFFSEKNPERWMRCQPFEGFGVPCITDDESRSAYVIANRVFVGGFTLQNFSSVEKLIACLLRAAGKNQEGCQGSGLHMPFGSRSHCTTSLVGLSERANPRTGYDFPVLLPVGAEHGCPIQKKGSCRM